MRQIGPIALLLLTAACSATTQHAALTDSDVVAEMAVQKNLILEQSVEEQARLDSLGFSLMRGAAALCGDDTKPSYGLTLATEHSFGADKRAAARAALGLDEQLRVLHVAPGSPADLAGVQVGDPILALDGVAVAPGVAGAKAAAATLAAGRPVTLALGGASPRAVGLAPVEICDYPIEVSSRPGVNAYATGNRIVVTREMMWFADDLELALVLSHELAHHVMNHVGSFIGAAAPRIELEAEADYVGLYIMARSGYAIDDAPQFWRRVAVSFPATTAKTSSHPETPRRFLALAKTVDEINAKIAAGRPLEPNTRRDGNG